MRVESVDTITTGIARQPLRLRLSRFLFVVCRGGAMLLVAGWLDNSMKSIYNPHFMKTGTWSDPTYDAMLTCFIDDIVRPGSAFAGNIAKALPADPAAPNSTQPSSSLVPPLNSAQFALEMIEGVQKVSFTMG